MIKVTIGTIPILLFMAWIASGAGSPGIAESYPAAPMTGSDPSPELAAPDRFPTESRTVQFCTGQSGTGQSGLETPAALSPEDRAADELEWLVGMLRDWATPDLLVSPERRNP